MTRIASHIIAQCFVIGSAAIVSGFTDATFLESAAFFALVWIGRFYGEEIYENMEAKNDRTGMDLFAGRRGLRGCG